MKGRQAEYTALAELDDETLARITPLVQLWPGSEPGEGETQAQQSMWPGAGADNVWASLRSQLLERIKGRWPESRPILVDGDWMGAKAFAEILEDCRSYGRKPLPVTGLGRSEEYQEVVRHAIGADEEGCVVRLGRSDFPPTRDDVDVRIDGLLSRFSLAPSEVDVVLDLRFVEREHWESDAILANSMLRALPRVRDWRNLAMAATGTPASAKGLPQGEIEPWPRVEWWIWCQLQADRERLPRLPAFGDYGVVHPDRVEDKIIDPKNLPNIPFFRYATNNYTLMVRGKDLEDEPDHLPALLARLIEVPEWSGPGFSSGDRWLAEVAAGDPKVGSRATWKKVGQVHHLTFVSRQLSTQYGF